MAAFAKGRAIGRTNGITSSAAAPIAKPVTTLPLFRTSSKSAIRVASWPDQVIHLPVVEHRLAVTRIRGICGTVPQTTDPFKLSGLSILPAQDRNPGQR